MRIITWNCKHSFSKEKIEYIRHFEPDLLIIQECIQSNIHDCQSIWQYCDWYGDHLEFEKYGKGDLGIGIFSNKYEIVRSSLHNKNIRYVVPYSIRSENDSLAIFSTWTKTEGCNNPYIGQISEALKYDAYQELLNKAIFIGDFNANMIWDIKENVQDFKNVISHFSTLHMKSAYHTYMNEEYGREKQSTSNQPKGNFHIDYCFVPDYAIIEKVEIKAFHKDRLSDHLPLIIELKV